MHGANRLAAIGMLSFLCVAGERSLGVVGTVQRDGQRAYVWPIWTEPLTLGGIEMLLAQNLPSIGHSEREARGIGAVMRARRVMKDVHGNVTLAAEA